MRTWGSSQRRKKGQVSEIELAIIQEREACAKLLEELAQDRRKMTAFMARERATLYKEIADALERASMFIRQRESV